MIHTQPHSLLRRIFVTYRTIQLLQAACAEEERWQYLKTKSEWQLEDAIAQINRLKNSEAANFQFPKPDAQDQRGVRLNLLATNLRINII